MTHISADDTLQKGNTFKRIVSFSWVKKSVLVEVIALLFVILFLYTGIAKLMEFNVFQAQLEDSPVLEPVAPIVAWGLPIVEFIVCVLLFFPLWRLKGLYATFILMTIFMIYVLVMLLTSPELPCSCGGIIEALSWPGHLIFNTAMVLLSIAGIRMQKANNDTV
jgi:uncharacterized membrane protein YphA (DoxX/SURF4 family)